MNQPYKATWTAMENATQADFEAVMDYEKEFNAALVDRLLAQLELLDEESTPYPIKLCRPVISDYTPLSSS